MSGDKPIKVNYFNRQSRAQVLSHEPLLSTQHLKLTGTNFDYYQYDAYEAPTHIAEHHVVCLMLGELKSERKLNGIYQQEQANFGSVAVMPANVEHWSAWKTPAKFAIFSIQPDTLAQIAPETIDADRVELIPTFAKLEPDRLLASIGKEIEQHLKNNPDGCSFYIEHLMNALLAHLVQKYCHIAPLLKESTVGLPPYKLKQVIEYINDNLEESIKLSDLAQLVNTSQFYFCRLFRESIGISPYKYVLQQRIKKTRSLIENSSLPLVDIAYESGFSSQSQMTHHFRKSVGVTPKVYRNRL